MIEAILAMKADLEMLKSAFGRSMKVGPVEEIDAEKGYRLKLGEGENGPFLSPWYPHPESGGQSSSWMPLSKGQIVGVLNPSGDARQGVIFRGGFSGKNTAPSQDISANVLKAFGITISMKDGTCTVATGSTTVEIAGEQVKVSTSQVNIEAETTNKGNVEIIGDATITGALTVGGGVALGGGGTASGDFKLSGAFEADGGKFTHNGKDIGSDHQHQGVKAGGSNTGTPV